MAVTKITMSNPRRAQKPMMATVGSAVVGLWSQLKECRTPSELRILFTTSSVGSKIHCQMMPALTSDVMTGRKKIVAAASLRTFWRKLTTMADRAKENTSSAGTTIRT